MAKGRQCGGRVSVGKKLVVGDFPEAITDATDRFNEGSTVAELDAEGADMDVDGPFEGIGVFAPAGIHQFVAGEGAAGLANDGPEQFEFGGGEEEFLSVEFDLVMDAIDFDAVTADEIGGSFGIPGAAEESLNAVDQRFDLEGFGDIVIRPHAEADDFIDFVGPGGEHEDGNISGPGIGAELAADFETLDDGKHEVKEDDVGNDAEGAAESFLSVLGAVDLETLVFEIVGEDLDQGAFILDDEDLRLGHSGVSSGHQFQRRSAVECGCGRGNKAIGADIRLQWGRNFVCGG